MTLREQVFREIEQLGEGELQQVAGYLEFLKLHSRNQSLSVIDSSHLSELYAEFDKEDRLMAEEGIEDWGNALYAEDKR